MHILIIILTLILSLFIPTQVSLAQSSSPDSILEEKSKIVKEVEIKGNKTISLSSVLAKIKTRVGQEYLQSVVSDDLKRLYNTGYFDDVTVDRKEVDGGFKVIFFVIEKSIVENITFTKIRYFKPHGLLKKIKTKKGKFLDNKSLNDDIRTIEELYSKKGLTLVSVKVEKEIDELTNKASLHFVINEGYRVKVRKITINGNTAYKDKKIIKIIKTRPAWLLNAGYLKEEVLEEDMERIKSFYERNGYIDAQATQEFKEYKEGQIDVIISILEGKKYFVENITISGNNVVAKDDLIAVMNEIKVGKIFSRERLTVDLSNIRTLYFDKGYIFANVTESTSLNSDTGKVDVKLNVYEGSLAYINKIKIQGNDRTRDIVIRRELKLFPGDQFDGEKLRRSKQRLTNLGYFEDISYDVEDTDRPDHKDLVVQIKEAKTGSLSFGGGFSTVDKVVGFVEIEQRNFDFTNWPTFTGGGQQLTLRAETGSTRSNTRISFTEPWLFDYPISGGFDAYRTERDKERDVGFAYDEERIGGALRLGKRFSDYVSGGVTYRMEEVDISDFDDGVSADLLAEEGENTVSSLSFTLTRDARDNIFSPTKGLYVSGTADVAGSFLGGDKDFARYNQLTSYFIPLVFDSVIEFRLRAGVVDAIDNTDKVPIFERFFAGGARTIRGYDERKVGPIDPVTEDPIGGEALLVGNIEYTIPIIEFLKLATFIDTGNVWSKLEDFGSGDFKSGAGVGLRVKTPIGPVNLDYGYPLNDEPGEEERSGKFYFSVSRGF